LCVSFPIIRFLKTLIRPGKYSVGLTCSGDEQLDSVNAHTLQSMESLCNIWKVHDNTDNGACEIVPVRHQEDELSQQPM